MRHRAAVVLMGLLSVGCACRPCRPCPPCPPPGATGWSGAPPSVAMPPSPAAATDATARGKPAPPGAWERLAAVAKAPDPVSSLLALAREAPDVLRDAPSGAWAPLLSDRVRLVDLGDVERDGGDAAPSSLGLGEGPIEDAASPVDPRVERIAASVRGALGDGAWDEATTLLAVRPWGLVVVQSPERWIDVEKALDRFAVAGGPSARVAALLADDADGLARAVGVGGGGWARADVARLPDVPGLTDMRESGDDAANGTRLHPPRAPEPPGLVAPPEPPLPTLESWSTDALGDAAWARAEAMAAVPILRIPLSGDRRVAAGRASRMAFVQDLELGPGNVVVPIVGTLVAGTSLRGWGERDRWRVDLVRAQTVQPLQVFETRLAVAVRIELPELRLVRLGAEVPPKAGSAVFVRGSGGAPTACLFRVEVHDEGEPTRPAWRLWKPAPAVPLGGRRAYGWPVSLRIERAAVPGGPSNPIAAPRLLLTEGEEGILTLHDEEAYVAGTVSVAPGRPNVGDPRVGVLVTGLAVRAKVVARRDGSAVVDGLVRMEDVDRPMRTFDVLAGPADPLGGARVRLPRTWRTDVPFRVRLKPGESTDFPAVARTSKGLESFRVRLTLGERVPLFTPMRAR